MSKLQMLAAVGIAALAAACAGTETTNNNAAPTASAQSEVQAITPASITNEQLRTYTAIETEIAPLQANLATQTPEQRAQTTAQISAVLARHSMEPTTFNAIARMANEDRAFATRLAAAQPDTFSDESLRAFAAASLEIDPISRTLATGAPEQQAQATEQIRQILMRNNLDSASYNAIAARAQADATFAARIQDLHRDNTSGAGE